MLWNGPLASRRMTDLSRIACVMVYKVLLELMIFQKEEIQAFLRKGSLEGSKNQRVQSESVGTKPKHQTLLRTRWTEERAGSQRELMLIPEASTWQQQVPAKPCGGLCASAPQGLGELRGPHLRNRKLVPGPSAACSEQTCPRSSVPNKHPSDSAKERDFFSSGGWSCDHTTGDREYSFSLSQE